MCGLPCHAVDKSSLRAVPANRSRSSSLSSAESLCGAFRTRSRLLATDQEKHLSEGCRLAPLSLQARKAASHATDIRVVVPLLHHLLNRQAIVPTAVHPKSQPLARNQQSPDGSSYSDLRLSDTSMPYATKTMVENVHFPCPRDRP